MTPEERLELYYAAEAAILRGAQAYTIGTRSFTRADLKEIREAIKEIRAEVLVAQRGGIRMRGGVPH